MKILLLALCALSLSAMADEATPSKVTLVDAPDYLPAVAALYEEGDGMHLRDGQEYLFEFDQPCDTITIVGFLGTNGEFNHRPEYTRKLNGSWAQGKWPTIEGQFSASSNPYSVIPSGTIVNKVIHPAPHVSGNDHVYVRGYGVGVQTVICTYTPSCAL